MRRIIGFVQTEHPEEAGTIVFTLVDAYEQLIPCRSGAGCKSGKPKRGDKVAVTGDTVRDLIAGGASHEFFYNLLEILPKNNLVSETRDEFLR
jgi:hypothetical protein